MPHFEAGVSEGDSPVRGSSGAVADRLCVSPVCDFHFGTPQSPSVISSLISFSTPLPLFSPLMPLALRFTQRFGTRGGAKERGEERENCCSSLLEERTLGKFLEGRMFSWWAVCDKKQPTFEIFFPLNYTSICQGMGVRV